MKRTSIIYVFLCIIPLFAELLLAQELTAIITVDDYQWSYQNNTPVDFATVFQGSSLTNYFAPLPVFFQGWQSSPRSNIVDYRWDFGDCSPVFHGFNAGHVYEIPGNYTASLTVEDSDGNLAFDTILINVLERNGSTYYVDSELGNDSYDGLSASFNGDNNGPWRTADRVFSEIVTDFYNPGDRILFNRGQTFQLTLSGLTPSVWPAWGYMMGAYGTGAKPVIQYSGENNAIIIHQYSIGFAHVSFVDLDFRFDDYNGHKAGVFFFAQGGGTRNILFLRVDALDLYSDLFVIGQYDERELGTGTFFVDSSIRNSYIDPLNNVTLFAHWASRFVCLNNYFDLSGNHIGYTSIDKGVIAGNTFSRPAFGRTALRICGFQEEGEDWNTDLSSNNVQISENYFHGWIDPHTEGNAHNGGGDRYNYLLVQLSPNGPWNQIIRDITFERNVITNGEGLLNIGAAENITVRNNILISDNSSAPSYFISIVDANKPSKNIKIIGNTLVARNSQYSGNIYEMSAVINIFNNDTQIVHPFDYLNHEEIEIKNNIFYINGENSRSRFIYVNNGIPNELIAQIASDNNLFYVSNGSDIGEFFQTGIAYPPASNAQYFTLVEWQSSLSKDVNSVFADPGFIDLLGSDGQFSAYGYDANLNIAETSSARGIGLVDLINSHYDFSLYQRLANDNSVDIGAYEYPELLFIISPQNVSISISDGSVYLSWDAVGDANSYKVFASAIPDDGFILISGEQSEFSVVDNRISWSGEIDTDIRFFYVTASTDN
ncbi:MAG: PKD domain-containing protein [Candidatus Cloacimonetes bacterium]|nr:PKD domain-containing protein [Candidatus Cloacimonadota bacterium]